MPRGSSIRNKTAARDSAAAGLVHAPVSEFDEDSPALWSEGDSDEREESRPMTRGDIERQVRARRRLEQYQEEQRLRRLIEDDWWDGVED